MPRARVRGRRMYGTHGTSVVLYDTVQCMLQVQATSRAHGQGGCAMEGFTSWAVEGISARTGGSLSEKGGRGGREWSDVLEAVVRASLCSSLLPYHTQHNTRVHIEDYPLPPPSLLINNSTTIIAPPPSLTPQLLTPSPSRKNTPSPKLTQTSFTIPTHIHHPLAANERKAPSLPFPKPPINYSFPHNTPPPPPLLPPASTLTRNHYSIYSLPSHSPSQPITRPYYTNIPRLDNSQPVPMVVAPYCAFPPCSVVVMPS